MTWFKKREDEERRKEEELPALPGETKLPKLPELPKIKLNEFPSIENTELKSVMMPSEKKTIELHELEKPESRPPQLSSPKVKEPIFVKLDKFKAAAENFSKIKEKVGDIEETLEKIKEVKEKEEEELKNWEHEIQLIKSRIDEIDDSLFNKLGA